MNVLLINKHGVATRRSSRIA